jgi:hypothetical protein
MNAKQLIPAALLAIAGAASLPAFAGGVTSLGNELTEQPQAQSTLSRAEVVAETRAWIKQGHFERTSYDELESVAVARQQQQQAAVHPTRAEVRAETAAFLKAHPNAEYERQVYGIAG